MPFALDSNPETSEISEALNYLLSNFGANLSADPSTGEIKGPTGTVIAYLYKFLAVKYADSPDGVLNFSDSPTNREYYGLRNNNDAAESSNPADYIWRRVAGGFGLTKVLWYQTTGGRQTQFAVSETAPDVGWLPDPGVSIDLDIITSGTTPPIVESFAAFFTPTILQVPRSGDPLTPSFTGISPQMYATDKGAVIAFSDAQTDTALSFVNNSWRIGNSSTTGNGDISYTNITIGNPTDAGDFAQWPNPTAMSNSPAYIGVPVRYKNSLGAVSQAGVATLQLIFGDPGPQGLQGANIDINGYTSFTQNAAGAFTPPNAVLSALLQNVISPTYAWAISGATPTSATTSSVVVTPTSSSTGVTVTLTVTGTNLPSPLSKTVNLPVVYDGAPGEAGANGVMSAFPSIYIWTGSSVPPTRPTTNSTYTWGTGAYTAPAGWSIDAPSNTVAGNYLWSITIPLNAVATATTSPLNWTSTSYPIRCIAVNGANGGIGLNGSRTAVLDMYRWSAIAPIDFPSGTSTYTWSLDTFTAPTTPNGWSLTPPAPVSGQTLYVVRQSYADSLSTATSSVTWSASESSGYAVSTTGTRTAFLELYQWAASAPTAFPSGSSTYTWATGSFTLPATPNGWSRSPGAPAAGLTLWGCQVALTTTGSTTTSSVSWTTSTAYAVSFGVTGSNGSATFLVTRVANDSSPPTNAEVNAVIGRNPVAGDIVTVSYNSANNAVVYRYTTSWISQATYITGSLIVDETITGNKVVANSIAVSKITSGTTSTLNGGVFALGNTGVVLNGFSGVGAFESITNSRFGLMAFQETPSSNTAAAIGASTYSNGAPAIAAFSSVNLNYNSFYTAAAIATNSASMVARFNRSPGTVGNNDLVPVNNSTFNTSDNAGYFAYNGATASNRITEVFLANTTTLSAAVSRRYNTTGTTLINETYLNDGSYAVTASLGAIYSQGNYFPFTGSHDGLIEESELPVVGDIVVDYQVEAILNPSNVVMLYKKSTTANQKGAVGVCIEVFDVPPSDWDEYQETGEIDQVTGLPIPDPTPIPNPMYYPIPAGQKVIHLNGLGEGTINVCGEGGNIEIGDLIVTSSISGKGMKQADDIVRSITVAKSRQAVTFSSSTEIKQIACIYLGG